MTFMTFVRCLLYDLRWATEELGGGRKSFAPLDPPAFTLPAQIEVGVENGSCLPKR